MQYTYSYIFNVFSSLLGQQFSMETLIANMWLLHLLQNALLCSLVIDTANEKFIMYYLLKRYGYMLCLIAITMINILATISAIFNIFAKLNPY